MRFFSKDFSLSGKVALITGAAQGIGEAIALLFAEKGTDLALVGLKKEVENVAQETEKFGRKVLPITGDFTRFALLSEVVERVVETFGHIDILVNNAGVSFLDDAENLTEGGLG